MTGSYVDDTLIIGDEELKEGKRMTGHNFEPKIRKYNSCPFAGHYIRK